MSTQTKSAPSISEPPSTNPDTAERDDEKINQLNDPSEISKKPKTKSGKEQEGAFRTTSWLDRAKSKMSEAGDAVSKRARQVQHRSAEHDAQRARETTERIFNEIGSTITGLTKSAVSMIVGGTYGTVSGLSKSQLPAHAKTIQAADELYHAGSWSDYQQGVEIPDGDGGKRLVDRFQVDLREDTALRLGANTENGWFYTDRSAAALKMTDPEGDRVEAISNPLYSPENDRCVGILAFVKEGSYAGQVLLHVEEK